MVECCEVAGARYSAAGNCRDFSGGSYKILWVVVLAGGGPFLLAPAAHLCVCKRELEGKKESLQVGALAAVKGRVPEYVGVRQRNRLAPAAPPPGGSGRRSVSQVRAVLTDVEARLPSLTSTRGLSPARNTLMGQALAAGVPSVGALSQRIHNYCHERLLRPSKTSEGFFRRLWCLLPATSVCSSCRFGVFFLATAVFFSQVGVLSLTPLPFPPPRLA